MSSGVGAFTARRARAAPPLVKEAMTKKPLTRRIAAPAAGLFAVALALALAAPVAAAGPAAGKSPAEAPSVASAVKLLES